MLDTASFVIGLFGVYATGVAISRRHYGWATVHSVFATLNLYFALT